MSSFTVTYAVATAPGAPWLEVIDCATGAKVEGVTEVDTEAGYVRKRIRDSAGRPVMVGDDWLTERNDGSFVMRPRADAPDNLEKLLRQAARANLGIRMTEGS